MPTPSLNECPLGGVFDPHELVGDWKIEKMDLGSRVPEELNIRNGLLVTRTDGTVVCNFRDEETQLCQRPLVLVQDLFLQMIAKRKEPSALKDKTLNNYFDAINRKLIEIFGPHFKPVPHDKKSAIPFYRAVLAQTRLFRAKCEMIVDPIESEETLLEELENQG